VNDFTQTELILKTYLNEKILFSVNLIFLLLNTQSWKMTNSQSPFQQST